MPRVERYRLPLSQPRNPRNSSDLSTDYTDVLKNLWNLWIGESEDDDASQRDIENPVYDFPVERRTDCREWFRDRRSGPGNADREAGSEQTHCQQRSRSV